MIRSLIRSLRRRIHLIGVLVLLGLLALGGATGGRAAAAPVPSLVDVSATTQTPALFTVTGAGFTAGGRVYLAVYDQMGTKLIETRWVTASLTTSTMRYPPRAGIHPGEMVTIPGGDLRQAFAGLCGAAAMIRALDEQTAVWSNWLPVHFACDGGDGPNRTGRPY
ncbi:MAG: hypothetical protein QOJ59_4337 [Thermomicrobiales bacterium]|jgi:hypothetical protein|nr:hypothetical protein [Thermomicrobiales bacterium]